MGCGGGPNRRRHVASRLTKLACLIGPQHIYFVFIDGVGLGADDPAVNPLARFELPTLAQLAGGSAWTNEAPVTDEVSHVFRPIDANLGVDGLPQSGTGQATLFTGVNCAEAAGRHYGPFPHSTSKPILKEHSVFARLKNVGYGIDGLAFANAYPQRFFVHAWERKRWTVTTYMCRKAGIALHSSDDLRAGTAIAAGITNDRWRDHLDPSMPQVSETQAARRFHEIGRAHAFTLFEYYLTDKIGHEQDFDKSESILITVDRFFAGLLDHLDLSRDLLLVSSDHGNIEDLSIKTHTRNQVPLVAYGAGAEAFQNAESLLDVTPTLVNLMTSR